MKLADLPTPALLLDLPRLDRNVRSMAARASDLGVSLRPHVKTHKCVEIATRQVAAGALGLTVSTMAEARAFAGAGIDDITWAVPLAVSRLGEIADLRSSTRLGVLVDSLVAVEALEGWPGPGPADGSPLFDVWIKVDCGYHRAGVDPAGDLALDLAARLAAGPCRFRGILTHSGQAYHCRGRGELEGVAEEERRVMTRLAERLGAAGVEVPAVSVGSTPAMCAARHLAGVDEARPGNYVFFDATQVALGSCSVGDCALTVLAEVVSTAGGRHTVINAGAVALSKDLGPDGAGYGWLYEDYEAGALMSDGSIFEVSQEHGQLRRLLPPGTRVRVQPNHACLTAASFDSYWVVEGDRVVDRWPIVRGW